MAGIATFDDWIDLFYKWRQDIGLEHSQAKDYRFDAIYEDPINSEVEFGEFAGQRKWERLHRESSEHSSPWLRTGRFVVRPAGGTG